MSAAAFVRLGANGAIHAIFRLDAGFRAAIFTAPIDDGGFAWHVAADERVPVAVRVMRHACVVFVAAGAGEGQKEREEAERLFDQII